MPNYYEKVIRYVQLISAPAKLTDDGVTAQTNKLIADSSDEAVFQYIDTNSSRANIEMINTKIEGQKIAIIGLGGKGSYILDMVAKTPVKEIHIYDADSFDQHNAFRSPGAASIDDLKSGKKKTAYFHEIYLRMHKYMYVHDYYVTRDNLEELAQMDYVFICIGRMPYEK